MNVNGKHALGKLIEKVQHENGWSDRDLARRAQSQNLELGKSNWSRLKNQPVLTFKPSHVKGLALVLNQTETVVTRAVLESMGIHLEGYQDGDVESAVRNNPELSRRDKNVMLAVFHELAKESNERSHLESQPEPHDESEPDAQGALTDEKMGQYDLAAYDTGQPRTMKQAQTDKQDAEAEGSQDPDDYEGDQ